MAFDMKKNWVENITMIMNLKEINMQKTFKISRDQPTDRNKVMQQILTKIYVLLKIIKISEI